MGNITNIIYHSKPTILENDINNVLKTLKSGHLEDGEEVIKLEENIKNFLNKKYVIAVNTGFAVIHLSLIAYNIKKGDEVIIPSYSCPALLNPILIKKAKPVLVDIEKNGFNISFKDLKQKLTKKTKLIILPYMFGFPKDISKIMNLGIPIIEDITLSIGAKIKGQLLGTFTDTTICSFYATKMITSGDGGILATNNKQIYEIAKNYRYYGHKKNHKYIAFNYHTTNLPMSLVNSQLNNLEYFIQKRKQIASIYDGFLNDVSQINIDFRNKKDSVFYRYLIEVKNRDKLKEYLNKYGIKTRYGVLEGLHQLLEIKGFRRTEKYLKNILSLPIYPSLSEKEAIYIAKTIQKFYKEYK